MTAYAKARAPAAVIWALGLTQIIGYGTLYYSFSALAPAMALDFGWSEEWVYGALSGSLLIGGLVAPISGSWADRFGAAKVMVWGSVAAALSLAVCALSPNGIAFVAGLVAMEVASGFVLYATAFAALAQIAGQGAQRSITHLTLIAGFASTIFWPLTTTLHEYLTWREVYLAFAALTLAVCVPVHAWLARQDKGARIAGLGATTPDAPLVSPGQERWAQIVMLLGFALLGFTSSAVLVHMIPMLASLGLGAAGVFVTTLFGPAQVLSRLVNMQFGKGLSQPALGVVAASLMPLALVVLVTTAPLLPGAAAFALLFGLGSGLSSIVSGTLPLALFGRVGYGRRLGSISSARLIVSSFAPVVFAMVAGAITTPATLWLVAGAGALSALCFAAIWHRYGHGVQA
ncbi:MAG TPA: arsenite efflux MFS transporter ArsK [Devosia sp.]|nr:arsenite efflux MFS transporter ArsK [Devosia sp.]